MEKKIEKVTYGLAKITDLREKFEKNTYGLGIKDFESLEKKTYGLGINPFTFGLFPRVFLETSERTSSGPFV